MNTVDLLIGGKGGPLNGMPHGFARYWAVNEQTG